MIIAAADGSSLSNPGPAGWAWYVDEDRWAAGGWAHGTNNMGELMAVLDLLRQTRGEELRVMCDSQYVINCRTKSFRGRKRRGGPTDEREPVLTGDQVSRADAAGEGRTGQGAGGRGRGARTKERWTKGQTEHGEPQGGRRA